MYPSLKPEKDTGPMVEIRRYRTPLIIGAAALLAGTAGWSLSPLFPSSPLTLAANPAPIMARPAAWQGGSIADIVERAEPAVVTITVTQQAQPVGFSGGPMSENDGPFGDLLRQFMGGGQMLQQRPSQRSEVLGSGFLIDDKGDILTNNHVVEGGSNFTVEFSDKSIAKATLVGTDPQTDLAVIHVDKVPAAQPLALADSDRLRVGDPVIAIGDPYGVGQTVTTGVVSARGRSLGTSSYVDYIQTDASINQGNSGGPLLDYAGSVVGVNSAIFSPTGGNVGIGFAVPSNTVRTVVNALRSHGKVTRAWLGVGIQDVSPSIAAAAGLAKADGAIVTAVDASGPSAGKLKAGDIITRFNGTDIHEARDLSRVASTAEIGNLAKLDILRQGQSEQIDVKMGRLAADSPQRPGVRNGSGEATPKLGLSGAPLNNDLRSELGLDHDTNGVVVKEVDPDGPAAQSGIRPGDVIERVGNQDVDDIPTLAQAVGKSRNDTALLLVNRGGNEQFVAVPLS